MSLFLSELSNLTCQSTEMFSQDEPDVEMVVIASVCLDSVCEPLQSVMCEIKDVVKNILLCLMLEEERIGGKKEKMGREGEG